MKHLGTVHGIMEWNVEELRYGNFMKPKFEATISQGVSSRGEGCVSRDMVSIAIVQAETKADYMLHCLLEMNGSR